MGKPIIIGDRITVKFYTASGVANGRIVTNSEDALKIINDTLGEKTKYIFFVTANLINDDFIKKLADLGTESPPLVVIKSISESGEIIDIVDVISKKFMA